ncbi:PH domain-containing protein [Candidatus Woesearchaeota archaeon]|nr:PH domain-containing protein [Candidatus Woesearchaeota archaeon]
MKQDSKQENPLFILRPNISVAIIPVIVGAIIAGIFVGFFVWTIFHNLITYSLVFGIITAMILAIVIIFFRLMNLNAMRYLFYQKKAEFFEGFLNIVQRTVQYDKVTDCVLTISIWDRLFGTGTIRLITAGHLGAVNYGGYQGAGGGIALQYLNNPNDVYKRIQKLIGKE